MMKGYFKFHLPKHFLFFSLKIKNDQLVHNIKTKTLDINA